MYHFLHPEMDYEKTLRTLLDRMENQPDDPKIQKWGAIGLEILKEIIGQEEKRINGNRTILNTKTSTDISTNVHLEDEKKNRNQIQSDHHNLNIEDERTANLLKRDQRTESTGTPLKNSLLVPEMKQYTTLLLQKSHQLHQKIEKEEIIDQLSNIYEEGGKRLEDEPIVGSTYWYYWMGTVLFIVAYLVIRMF